MSSTARPNVFMFSGQGSHYYQMGRELFEQHATFRRYLLELDEAAKGSLGFSVVDSIYDERRKKTEPFDRTRSTHPAIFMVEHALAKTLSDEGLRPDYVLGTSMGSFAALTLAGCLGVEDALGAVIEQAAVLESRCRPGGMVAILHSPRLSIDGLRPHQDYEVAAINSPSHFAVAARDESLAAIESFLRRENIMFQRLAVSQAFHSRWIDEAKEPYVDFLKTVTYRPCAIPFVCCARATRLDAVAEDYLWRVIREPIEFERTIAFMESQGSFRYIDVGPSSTLASILKHSLPPASSSEVFSIMTLFGQDMKNLRKLLS